MTIDRVLARGDLDPEVRLLVLGQVAIWRADWPRLTAVFGTAKARGSERADCEEMLLQAVLFCGFPRVVTAFEHFESTWPATTPPAATELPTPAEQAARGRALFDRIYGKNAEAVRAMLGRFHPDFQSFVLEAAYGRILARSGLAPRVRELVALAALVAADQKRQFAGHARGAQHLGATRREIEEVVRTVFCDHDDPDAAAHGWVQRIPAPAL